MNPGDTITIALAAETTLTVTVPSGASGTLTRLSDQPGGGDPSAPTVLNGADVTVAATGSPRRYMITCSAGTITYAMTAADPGGSLPMTVVSTDGSGSTTPMSSLGYIFSAGDASVAGQDTVVEGAVGGTAGVLGGNSTNGSGGNVELAGGGGRDGGGNATVQAGHGLGGVNSDGGLAQLEGGNGAGADGDGGNTIVQAGLGTGTGNGGETDIVAGAATGTANGGVVRITAGNAVSGSAGSVILQPGLSTSGANGNVLVNSLPTADPHVVNALWISAGALKVSAG